MDDENNINVKDRLTIFISLITILTPFLYLLGMGFSHGWLSSFGVEGSFFPQTIEDNLINAYYFITLIFINALEWIQYLIYGFILLIIIRVTLSDNFYNKIQMTDSWFYNHLTKCNDAVCKRFSKRLKNEQNKIILFDRLNTTIFLLMLLLIAPVFSIIYGERIGNDKRELYLEKGCSNEDKWNTCVEIVNISSNEVIIKGMFIAHSENYVAILTSDGSQLIKLTDNEKIVRELNK